MNKDERYGYVVGFVHGAAITALFAILLIFLTN